MQPLNKKTLFWDVDTERLSYENDCFFIIERIFEFGDIEDFIWIKKVFKKELIEFTIRKSRSLSKRTRNFCHSYGYAS